MTTEWLERRQESFGASEMMALLVALGMEKAPEGMPKYMQEDARLIFKRKARKLAPERKSQAATAGQDAELPLIMAWNERPTRGFPAPVIPAGVIPSRFLPILHRKQPRLSMTPDGWAHFHREFLIVEVKTDVHGGKTDVTPWWWWQCQTQMAVADTQVGLVLYGERWIAWHDNKGPIHPWIVERDEAAVARCLEAAELGWREVEKIKEAANG